jgi:hypothetical protein
MVNGLTPGRLTADDAGTAFATINDSTDGGRFSGEVKTLLLRGSGMRLKIVQVIMTIAALVAFAFALPFVMAQEDTVKGKQTVGGQMKEGGKEMGKAAKSLGGNVKRGRVVRGGKQFGKHAFHGGKHVTKGSVKAVKKTGRTVKKTGTSVKKVVSL